MSEPLRDPDEFVGLARLAQISGLSVRTLRDRIHDVGDPLPAFRVGGKLLVRRVDFRQWMERRRYAVPTVDAIVEEMLKTKSAGEHRALLEVAQPDLATKAEPA